MTPSGIEPATFRFVAQHLNHCATAVPFASQTSCKLSVWPRLSVRHPCVYTILTSCVKLRPHSLVKLFLLETHCSYLALFCIGSQSVSLIQL